MIPFFNLLPWLVCWPLKLLDDLSNKVSLCLKTNIATKIQHKYVFSYQCWICTQFWNPRNPHHVQYICNMGFLWNLKICHFHSHDLATFWGFSHKMLISEHRQDIQEQVLKKSKNFVEKQKIYDSFTAPVPYSHTQYSHTKTT